MNKRQIRALETLLLSLGVTSYYDLAYRTIDQDQPLTVLKGIGKKRYAFLAGLIEFPGEGGEWWDKHFPRIPYRGAEKTQSAE